MTRILCTVSGGVTGFNQAYLKNDGGVIYFENGEAAQIEADRLTQRHKQNMFSRCSITYEVVCEA